MFPYILNKDMYIKQKLSFHFSFGFVRRRRWMNLSAESHKTNKSRLFVCGFNLGQKLQSCMRTKRLLRQSYILYFRHCYPTIYLYHYFFFIIALSPSMELNTSKQVKMTCNAEHRWGCDGTDLGCEGGYIELREIILFNNSINQYEKAGSTTRVDSMPVPSLIAVLKAV